MKEAPSFGRQAGALLARFDTAVEPLFDTHLRGRKAIDFVMYFASAAGEHSLVWLVLAALQCRRRGSARSGRQEPTGWRLVSLPCLRSESGWSCLARAGLVLGAESLLVNGLVKSFFRRARPKSVGPHPLPLRTPRSSSFPSGHSSAAFFSAALLRGRGAPSSLCYLLAVVVSASRVHVRAHYASDVVAGAALGALLGEVVRRWSPLGQ